MSPKDRRTALEWFEKAAEGGIVDAQYKAGVYYFDQGNFDASWGSYKIIDKKNKPINKFAKASKFLQEAAEAGHKDAIKFLKKHANVFGKLSILEQKKPKSKIVKRKIQPQKTTDKYVRTGYRTYVYKDKNGVTHITSRKPPQ